MPITATENRGTAGPVQAPPVPARPAPVPLGPAPGPNGPAAAKAGRIPEFPFQLKLNITKAMVESLERLHRSTRLKQGVIGRLGLMEYLAARDPQYREED
jgi:hypothetical protein